MKYSLIILILIVAGCSPEKAPINYGHDGCSYCKMSIVDPRFAAELVTDKGKVYKFDAVECMLNQLNEEQGKRYSLQFISTFDKQELTPAEACYFLRSPELPSPMGMYLAGFSSQQVALDYQSKYGGKLYSFQEIKEKIDQLSDIKPTELLGR